VTAQGTGKRISTNCNTRQHTATNCNTLQHTATHARVPEISIGSDCARYRASFSASLSFLFPVRIDPLVAMCCSVLQCVAVYCSMLQCVAVCCSVLQCVAVCCSVLQCVARQCFCFPLLSVSRTNRSLSCSVLQCVAVCCSVLQWVAECCGVMKRAAVGCTKPQFRVSVSFSFLSLVGIDP